MRPQMRIEPVAKAPRHKMFCNIAMRDLPQRVHAGVGAARAVNANLLAADRLDRGSQRPLHRGAIVLDLPAAERRTVIFDDEFIAGHFDPVIRHHPRKRMIQYSAAFLFNFNSRGVLDTPPARGMTVLRRVSYEPYRRLQRRAAPKTLRLPRLPGGT